jgi:hypothetical protein
MCGQVQAEEGKKFGSVWENTPASLEEPLNLKVNHEY